MTEVLEINYISPTSDYIFDKAKKYYLVFINSGKTNNVLINKIEITEMNNINEIVRSYHIGLAIPLYPSSPNYSIKLFESYAEKIKLIFTGNLNIAKLEYGSKVIKLNIPSKILGNYRIGTYDDNTSFLQEQFFNYEVSDNDKCLLFVSKMKKTTKEITKTYNFKFDDMTDTYLYDRYNSNIIREQNFIGLDSFCQSNTFDDYVKFVKTYNIDVNKYINKPKDTFKSMFMRKINPKFRPLNFDPYLNNVICSPTDGRTIGFNLDSNNFRFYFFGNSYHYTDFVKDDAKDFINASGFITRMTPYDYQRIHVPYSGYVTGMQIMNNSITLKFESDYFIPPNVHEREYISVVYGHNIQMSRAYPELTETQPKTKLVFYIILLTNKTSDSIIFTNTSLNNIKQATHTKKIKFWMDQGEELGVFNCCLGTILMLVNRPIKFSDDINFYSNSLNKQIECYIRTKDLIGLIQ